MNLSSFRLLTFDVTNTLLKFRISIGKQYDEIGTLYGISCNTNLLAENFKNSFKKMSKEHPNFGQKDMGWENWWKEIVINTFQGTKTNVDNNQLDNIASHLINAYETNKMWEHCSGALDLLSYLKHKRVPLGVISNFDPRLNKTLENAKLKHYFKFVITSYEAGIEKPNLEIFQNAIKLSEIKNLKPHECLHIGDDVDLDYMGAINAGWNAALIYDKNQGKNKKIGPSVNEKHIFPSLFYLHKHFLDASGEKLIACSKY